MKRIVIYVHNEEIEELRPTARRLEKKGALVTFSALKYREVQKADLVLTTPRHLDNVRDLFRDTGVPVQCIEDEDAAPTAPLESINPFESILVEVAEEAPVVITGPPEETPALSVSADAIEETVVMTVSSPEEVAPSPAPSSRRSRRS